VQLTVTNAYAGSNMLQHFINML